MRKLALASLMAAIAFVGSVGPAGSGEPILTDTYIFKGGDAFGRVLEAATLTSLVEPASNPNSLANGSVEEPNAQCNARHYVGDFQSEPTPKNGNGVPKSCGWGKLSRVPAGLNVRRSYATAWTATETAHRVLLGLRDLGGTPHADAATQIAAAIVALELLQEQLKDLKQAGTISKDQKDAIEKKRQLAKQRLVLAEAGLLKLTIDPAIESRKGTLVYFVIIRQLVLAEDQLTKLLQKMEDAGLLPGAS